MLPSQTTSGELRWAGLAIALYTGWNARSLLDAWQHSPFDHGDGLAWLIWMLPVFLSFARKNEARLGWLVGALLLSFAGNLLDLNALKHLAFAVACAGLVSSRRGFWLWFLLALTWMPALGWLLSKFGLGVIVVGLARVLFAALGTLGYTWRKP